MVREFMKLHDVPQALSERVMDYVTLASLDLTPPTTSRAGYKRSAI